VVLNVLEVNALVEPAASRFDPMPAFGNRR
jgi:hypothetical protein